MPPLCPAVWLIFILYLRVRSVLKSHDALFTSNNINNRRGRQRSELGGDTLVWRMKTYLRKIPPVLLGIQTNSSILSCATGFIIFLPPGFTYDKKNCNQVRPNHTIKLYSSNSLQIKTPPLHFSSSTIWVKSQIPRKHTDLRISRVPACSPSCFNDCTHLGRHGPVTPATPARPNSAIKGLKLARSPLVPSQVQPWFNPTLCS